MFPPEYFSHPRITSFCHRTGIWRQVKSLSELELGLFSLLTPPEIKRWEAECRSYDFSSGLNLIDIYSTDYPQLLKEIYDPPLVLAYAGNISLFQRRMVSIVGTRKAAPISLLATHFLLEALREIDPSLVVVSGMALGVDRKAFVSALELNLGVIGILGTCLDEEYPPGNRDLYKKVKDSPNGLLVTEFVSPTEPARWTFPKRNRLISGLSTDVYIMESGKKSGTLSTAMSALSQNREIHVFDHPLQYDNAGGHFLLSDGASVLSWENISANKGQIERPDFYSSNTIITDKEWKEQATLERNYLRHGKKTPLGRGAFWVRIP